MPACGSRVVNGYGATSGVARVSRVSSRLLPTLGAPTTTYCPAPCLGILWLTPTFLGCLRSRSTSSLASLILVFRSAWSFSEALCLGTREYIFFRQARRSSAVWAFLY